MKNMMSLFHDLFRITGNEGGHRAFNRIFRGGLYGLFLWIALVGGSSLVFAVEPIEITVETTECGGEIGFTSFFSSDLYKIQSADCSDPNEPGKKLQQVLLKSTSGVSSFNVLWVTQAEARSIMQQIRESRGAKLKHLTKPKVIIKKETVIKHEPARPVEERGAAIPPPTAALRGELVGPTINLIDPPVANTRSITNVITPAGTEGRLIVGRVDAPAGLLSLTINGQPFEADAQGLFKANVPVSKSKTPVSIVAVDKQGKRSEVEFRLLPEAAQERAGTAGGQAAGDGVFGTYHALVIANNQYQKLDDLSTPSNDADAVSQILKQKYGFTVTRLQNATRYEILSTMNKLRKSLTEKDNLLIFYAGHGEYDKTNNRGHWLPVDAERDSTANWVSTIAITDILNAMSAKHILVIADSCYSGALTRSANTELDPGMSDEVRMKWLRAIAKTRSRYVLTSGGVKPVLDDGGNGHSIFASALIEALNQNQGILEGSKLYRDVKARVEVSTEELNVDQTPQYAKLKRTGHEYGEFLLVGEK
ncbi:MAG: caspase family protein [Candidatus Sedimenticola sp. (ex Thyasira tokunagai)]